MVMTQFISEIKSPFNTPLSPKKAVVVTPKFTANEILNDNISHGSLWIGNYSDSLVAHKHGIHCVINLADECKTPVQKNNYSSYYHYHLFDKSNFTITHYLNEITNLINEMIESGKQVLVHCREGISRSPAFIIAYLIKFKKMIYDDAYEFVNKHREKIALNFGFRDELQNYH
jgi:protein tyrosine phosphatase